MKKLILKIKLNLLYAESYILHNPVRMAITMFVLGFLIGFLVMDIISIYQIDSIIEKLPY